MPLQVHHDFTREPYNVTMHMATTILQYHLMEQTLVETKKIANPNSSVLDNLTMLQYETKATTFYHHKKVFNLICYKPTKFTSFVNSRVQN